MDKISLEEILFNIHQMGAELLNIEEVELDELEAAKLANAVKTLGEYYTVAFDPKKLAIFNLIQVAGFIYGPRVIAFVKGKTHPKHPEDAKPAAAPKVPAAPAGGGAPNPTFDPGKVAGASPSQLWPQTGELTGPIHP